MFPLGHVGIGTHLVPRRLRERLPWRWLALGCLLPDVIDKPIWMVARLFNAPWAHVETARLLGHTAFVALAFAMAAWLLRRPKIVALAYGIPTHLFLDGLADAGMGFGLGVWKSWLFWPWEIPDLHILMVASPLRELSSEARSPVYVAGEILGIALLLWDYARNRSKQV